MKMTGKTGQTSTTNKMSYLIEEIENGDSFEANGSHYIITCDFRKNGNRLAVNLRNGGSEWFEPNTIVDKISLMFVNRDNNMVAIKETKKDDIS